MNTLFIIIMPNYHSKHSSQQSSSFQLQAQTSRSSALQLNPSQMRGFVGWLSAVLQPHSHEFVQAFKQSKRKDIISLMDYLKHNFSHLKQIVHFFIIALLIDYRWVDIHEPHASLDKQQKDSALDVLVEDLAVRFYQQSQWLTKIMHIPIYELFTIVDQFSKGYVTLLELRRFCNIRQGSNQQQVIDLIDWGFQQKIYLENMKELQFRVDLISFEADKFNAFYDCSQVYAHIYSTLNQYDQALKYTLAQAQQRAQGQRRQILQRIDINMENRKLIKQSISLVKIKKPNIDITSVKKDSANKQRALQETRVERSRQNALADSQTLPSPQYQPLQVTANTQQIGMHSQSKGKQPTLIVKHPIYPHARQLQICKQAHIREALLTKAAILNELQHLAFQKYNNRQQLITYF